MTDYHMWRSETRPISGLVISLPKTTSEDKSVGVKREAGEKTDPGRIDKVFS